MPSDKIAVANGNIADGIVTFRVGFPPFNAARIIITGAQHYAVIVRIQEAAADHDVVCPYRERNAVAAVSYTHLDVYKRQVKY